MSNETEVQSKWLEAVENEYLADPVATIRVLVASAKIDPSEENLARIDLALDHIG